MAMGKRSGVGVMTAGITLMVLGLVAIATPAFAGGAVVIVIGAVLVGAGATEIVQGVQARAGMGRWLQVSLGVLAVLCGVVVFGYPFFGLRFLVAVLIAFFVLEGVCKLVLSWRYRDTTVWLWMLAGGVLTLLLAVVLWRQWPLSEMWLVGSLVGIDLLATGASIVALGAARRSAR